MSGALSLTNCIVAGTSRAPPLSLAVQSLARAETLLSHSQYSHWHERSPSSHSQYSHWHEQGPTSLTHSTVTGTSGAPPLSLTVQSLARAEPHLSHSQYSHWHERSPSSHSQYSHWHERGPTSLTHSTVTGTSGALPLSLTVQSLARAEPLL